MADNDVPWPNLLDPVDGVVPVTEVSQDPTLFDDLEDDAEEESA